MKPCNKNSAKRARLAGVVCSKYKSSNSLPPGSFSFCANTTHHKVILASTALPLSCHTNSGKTSTLSHASKDLGILPFRPLSASASNTLDAKCELMSTSSFFKVVKIAARAVSRFSFFNAACKSGTARSSCKSANHLADEVRISCLPETKPSQARK